MVVELHLEEGGTTYRGLGYNNRLALMAACRFLRLFLYHSYFNL